jgi:Zn-dependent M28 family amino/carboxypeptidase
MEVAKQMVQNTPKRSVVFVFYTAEEPCLWGSQYFVANYPKDRDGIVININVEMTGKRDRGNRGTTAIGPTEFEKYFNHTFPLPVNYLDLESHKERYSGSDQLSFYRQGLSAVRFGNLDYPEKHTSRDDISIIDFRYLKDITETLYNITRDIANE